MKKIIFLGMLMLGISSIQGQTWQNLNAKASIGASYLITASHLDDNILVVGNNQQVALSTDKGASWSAPPITRPPGQFVALYNGGDRMYANMRLNTFDYELHYTQDNGATWTRDTIGLPQNYVNSGKLSMNVKYMGNDYLMAYDGTHSSYKQNGASSWTQVTISTVVADIAALNDVWYVLGQNDIFTSSDHGATWSPMPLNGLPTGNGWFKITSNGLDRLYVLEAPANGGNEVYYTDDFGASWNLTNSAGLFTYQYAWLGAMYAVENYVFAAVNPAFGGFLDPPPYMMSSSAVPNFQIGDTTGLFTGVTTTALPFFFHIDDQLYTMNGDLLSSTPGFSGTLSVATEIKTSFKTYPNPTDGWFYLESPIDTYWRLSSLNGQLITEGITTSLKTEINIESLPLGLYLLQSVVNGRHSVKKIVKQ